MNCSPGETQGRPYTYHTHGVVVEQYVSHFFTVLDSITAEALLRGEAAFGVFASTNITRNLLGEMVHALARLNPVEFLQFFIEFNERLAANLPQEQKPGEGAQEEQHMSAGEAEEWLEEDEDRQEGFE